MSPAINLQLRPSWEEIDEVREQSATFLEGQELDREVVDAVTMVACELTENAVKYGSFEDQLSRVDVALEVEHDSITVQVRSRVREEDEENLERLDRIVQWIRGHQDPFQAYLERLKEVSSQSLHNRDSGLGLVRIAYEGQAILDFFVDETNYVSVSAIYTLTQESGESSR